MPVHWNLVRVICAAFLTWFSLHLEFCLIPNYKGADQKISPRQLTHRLNQSQKLKTPPSPPRQVLHWWKKLPPKQLVTGAVRYNEKTAKTILFATSRFDLPDWDYGEGSGPFLEHGCRVQNCHFTTNRSYHGPGNEDKFDALLFNALRMQQQRENLSHIVPTKRSPHQRYVFESLESSDVLLKWSSNELNHNFFNLTWTFRRDSDLYQPFGYVVKKGRDLTYTRELYGYQAKVRFRQFFKNFVTDRPKLVFWQVSNCKPKARSKLVSLLQNYISVDICGDCGNLTCPRNIEFLKNASTQYKFYLALENSFCTDYISEKMWRVLGYDIVPIVMGGADYASIAPPHSYINAADFKSVKDLANYLLYLDQNDDAYLAYFAWKRNYAIFNTHIAQPICGLCEILNNANMPHKSYDDINQWWFGPPGQSYCYDGTLLPILNS